MNNGSNSQSTGQDCIELCTTEMGVKSTMLAGLLNVSERTLSNWSTVVVTEEPQGRFDRLKAISKIVSFAKSEGVRGKSAILNLLNNTIPGQKEDLSLLHFVVEEPNNILLDYIFKKAVLEQKQEC